MNVVKRDGRKVEFNPKKIEEAMLKAFKEVNSDRGDEYFKFKLMASDTAYRIEQTVKITDVSVEEIQDFVVAVLNQTYPSVGSAYQRYREERTKIREMNSPKFKKAMDKLEAKNTENLNANVVDDCFSGILKCYTEVYFKENALEFRMNETTKNNHINNMVYQHDLDSWGLAHNCLSLPIDYLLANGAEVKQTDLRPAKSISSACQLLAVYCQLQSLDMFGGVAATHLDHSLVPYYRYSFYKHFHDGLNYVEKFKSYDSLDNVAETSINDEYYNKHEQAKEYAVEMTDRELKQAIEAMFHNLNSLQSRSGGQLPFTSIAYGTCTSTEGRKIISAILNQTITGLGSSHRTSIFPCQIFKLRDGVNLDQSDPNYDLFLLAMKSASTRIYPNFLNGDHAQQKEWVRKDREQKITYLNLLSPEQRNILNEHLEQRHDWAKELRLEKTKDGFMPIMEEDPCEELTTMGKCKLAHVKQCEPRQWVLSIVIANR